MIPNDRVQAAMITKFKSMASLVALLQKAADIKENQWQGRDFVYPAVRVKLGTQTPIVAYPCSSSFVPMTVQVHSEDASSKEADAIAGLLASSVALGGLNGLTWSAIIEGVRFVSMRTTGLVSAVREDERTWRAEVNFLAIVEPLSTSP
jgi:hypothetical protein